MITPFDDFINQTTSNHQVLERRVRSIEQSAQVPNAVWRQMLPKGTVGSNCYTVTAEDSYIGWCGGTASKGGTIQFPGPGTPGMRAGRIVYVKDEVGSAASFPILIEGTSAQSFDGIGSVKIDVNYGAVGVVSDGTAWQVAFRNPPTSFGSAHFGDEVTMKKGLAIGGTTTTAGGSVLMVAGSVKIGGLSAPGAALDVTGNTKAGNIYPISSIAYNLGFDYAKYKNSYAGTAWAHTTISGGTAHSGIRASANDVIGWTDDGGMVYRMYNMTGSASTKGMVVRAYSGFPNAFQYCAIGLPDPIGVVYEAGVANNGLCWVVISGRAAVYFANAATVSYFARMTAVGDTGAGAGIAICETSPTSPFSTDKHFQEIGHIIGATGADNLGTVILHFN